MPISPPAVTAVLAAALQLSPIPLMSRGTATVTIEADDAASPPAFVDAVERALGDAGYTLLPQSGQAASVATLRVRRTVSGAAPVRGRSGTVYPGGGTSFGNAVGMGIAVPFGKTTSIGRIVATELSIRIDRRGSDGARWEGRAITYRVAGSRGDDPDSVAKSLTSAILRNLDAPSGVFVSVP